jgi:hypothetical protein
MVTNSPSEHTTISQKEFDYIERSLCGESKNEVCVVYSFVYLRLAAWYPTGL